MQLKILLLSLQVFLVIELDVAAVFAVKRNHFVAAHIAKLYKPNRSVTR